MKNKIFPIFILFSVLFVFVSLSCKSTPVQPVQPKKTETPITKPETKKTTTVIDEPDLVINSADEEEYVRSVKAIESGEIISHDTFAEDKKAILSTIDELAVIMQNKDYDNWLNYLTPQFIEYWKQKSHLQAVSARLPGNKIQLKTLEDYFNWVFRLSRQSARIDEIRYISSKVIKAVEVRGNQDIVYYNFEKQNGKWLVSLDTLDI